jgi:hypothetical protein
VKALLLFLFFSLQAAADPCGPLRLRHAEAQAGLSFRHDPGKSDARHLPETMGSGLAWLDYDGDGWQDLYVVQSGVFPPAGSDTSARGADRLFRNRGDGTFEDVTARARIADRGYGQGATAADVDGDGDTDLYLTDFGQDTLLVNRGDGTFEDASARSGLNAGGWSSSAAFADADGDGDLDLYVARYVKYDPDSGLFCGDFASGRRDYCDISLFEGETDLFYRNRGDGTFEDATAAAGFSSANGRGLGVLFTDLDGDRRPDVYVANDETPNLLFHNLGGGRFEDVSLFSGAAVDAAGKAQAGMGLAAGDFDGDGDPEITVTNFDAEVNSFYKNLGDLQFEDASASSGFGPPSYNLLGFGIVAADLDLDGDLDAYVANGHVFEHPKWDSVLYAQPDLILAGDGRGRFENRSCALPPGPPQVGRGLAAGDYDSDGRPDLAMQNSGGPLELLRNETEGAAWVGVVLEGKTPNTAAVGAKVTLVSSAGGIGDNRRQVRWSMAGDSYQSTSDRRLLFGLPAGEAPKELEVVWPSGRTQRIAAPPAGRYLTLTEEQP